MNKAQEKKLEVAMMDGNVTKFERVRNERIRDEKMWELS